MAKLKTNLLLVSLKVASVKLTCSKISNYARARELGTNNPT